MHYPSLLWLLSFLSWFSDLAFIVVLLRKKLHRVFPALTGCCTWAFVTFLPLAAVYFRAGHASNPRRTSLFNLYGHMYFTSLIVDWVLVSLMILEFYRDALRGCPGLAAFFRKVLLYGLMASGALVAASTVVAGIVEPSPTLWLRTWLFGMNRSVRVMQAVLLLGLLLTVSWFRVRIPRLLRALVAAWLLVMTFNFACAALQSQFGARFDLILSFAQVLSYLASIVYLTIAAWKWGAEAATVRPVVVLDDPRRQAILNRLESIMQAMR